MLEVSQRHLGEENVAVYGGYAVFRHGIRTPFSG